MVDGTGDTLMCAELGDAASVMVPDQSTVKKAKDKISAVLAGNSSEGGRVRYFLLYFLFRGCILW